MSSFMFMGREYKADDFLRDTIGLAQELALNARLHQPLSNGVDLNPNEQKRIQSQIHAMVILPQFALDDIWGAFSAHHLAKLGSSLRALNPKTQPEALATLIQILSLLPDPSREPYFRKFLRNSSQSKDLPTLIAGAFVRGIAWKRPSGPGHICSLIIHTIQWCDTSLGDDGKASVDAEVRKALVRKLGLLIDEPGFQRIEQAQRAEVERLKELLGAVEHLPGDQYASSTRRSLERRLDYCLNPDCAESAGLTCAKCKSVKYCSKGCQAWHWKNGHKLRCFETSY